MGWKSTANHWTRRPDAAEISARIQAKRALKPGSNKGRIFSEEWQRNLSRAHKGGIGGFTGHHHTTETKECIAAAKRGKPHPARRARSELFDSAWVEAQYRTKSITQIATNLGSVSSQTVYRALKRYEIPIRRNEHASRAGKTSSKAIEQRRSLSYRWPSKLQRTLGLILYRLGFTDIQHEKPFYTFNVDWYSPSQHLAFEADGSFHQLPRHKEHDERRDHFLLSYFKLPVIRLDSNDIRKLERAVL